MTVRLLERSDRTAWQGLWAGYLDFYRAELDDDLTRSTFERLCGGEGALAGLVAEAPDGAVVGFAHLVFHPSTWSHSGYCYLEDLYVERSHRGDGTATELLAAVYQEADRRGVDRTYWMTQQFNGAARSLYDLVAHPTSFIVYER